MSSPPLTSISYIVLGLVHRMGTATPYDLKQAVAGSVGNFWSVPHSQLYRECDRLASAELLEGEQESAGRRRKRYKLTKAGEEALENWLQGPPETGLPELRDPALLQLFFGADRRRLAREQAAAHQRKLERYQELRSHDPGDGPRGPWLALDAGIAHEREWVRFWRDLSG